MKKKIFDNNYGIEYIPIKNKLSCNSLYNYKCFDDKDNYILMYIKYEDKISEIKYFYEDFHNIRYKWEKLNHDISKLGYIDENTKFILNWSINTLDHLADKEYYELSKHELVCYYILGNTFNQIQENNINADNINADNINADNINADNINADNINADNINADNINADNINADNINVDN